MTKNYFKIGKVKFSESNCVIIAEAGVNHNGSLKLAEKLIKEAKHNGADIIKFQTYKAENLTIKKSPRFWNWAGEKIKNGSQYDSYKALDKFNEKEYKKISDLCKKYKIEFMSTPFDHGSVDMLTKIGVKGFKIASCDISNFPLLKKVASKKLPILLSTGASNLKEIKAAVSYLKKQGNKKICVMHCTLCYPTKPEDVNFSGLIDIKNNFKNHVLGLSDHTLGINSTLPAVAMGVRVIEKHFTVDKKLKKSADHWLSLDPKELNQMRKNVDDVLLSLGKGGKKVLACEKKTRMLARRSIVLKCDLKKGNILSEKNITCKRPGNGMHPKFFDKIIGKKLTKNLLEDHQIKSSDITK
jgi:N,N'-diacetyllegionaminate synthase